MKATKEPLTEMQKKEVLRMNNKESNQLTRECLQLALMHLMGEHPYEKITVSEIVRRAGVSRTAFYRNYTDKEDIYFARKLALQTLSNIDNLSFNDIKRRLTEIIEVLVKDPEVKYEQT